MIRRIPRDQLLDAPKPLTLAASAAKAWLSQRPTHDAKLHTLSPTVLTQVVRAVLGEELALKPQHIRAVVERELPKLRGAASIQLHVHPEDAALLEPATSYCERLELVGTLQVVLDEGLERGGCVLLSERGEVDARLEIRISVAVELLAAGAFDEP